MNQNPIKKLESYGQSIWIDFIRRGVITSGQLKRWIDEDGVSGVTSNPSIFEKAIVDSHDYDDTIEYLMKKGKSATEIYETVTIEDIQQTTDLFRPVFKNLQGKDGFASLEVSPHLAHDTEGTIAEARKLWQTVDRPNVMIKVPGTREGLPAIRQLISEGININITLLFGLPRYREVIEAYFTGLEMRAVNKQPIDTISSVASFFLSRIDVLIDPQLEKIMADKDPEKAQLAKTLHGQVAIASAKAAYAIYEEAISGARFQSLKAKGANLQRLLWASTSTKNPDYPDTKYIEPLIGPDTINTVPIETLDAYRDHGNPAPRLKDGQREAWETLKNLNRLNINLDAMTQQLEDEGVEKFNKAYDQLMDRLKAKLAVQG